MCVCVCVCVCGWVGDTVPHALSPMVGTHMQFMPELVFHRYTERERLEMGEDLLSKQKAMFEAGDSDEDEVEE